MQGLRQTGALAFLQREQRLCQPVVIRSRVFQRGSHVIEALGEFARLGEAMGRQPGIEPPVGDTHQRAEQLCQHTHAGAHRPTDRQQAKQQGHSEKSQQLQQRIPDFLDLVARIDADLQALAPGKLQLTGSGQLCRIQPRAEPVGEQRIAAVGRWLPGRQPAHPHMPQAIGKFGAQGGGIALGHLAEVGNHGCRSIQFALHVVARLAQQHSQADHRHEGEEQCHQQVQSPERGHIGYLRNSATFACRLT